jgi:hypothetical protein
VPSAESSCGSSSMRSHARSIHGGMSIAGGEASPSKGSVCEAKGNSPSLSAWGPNVRSCRYHQSVTTERTGGASYASRGPGPLANQKLWLFLPQLLATTDRCSRFVSQRLGPEIAAKGRSLLGRPRLTGYPQTSQRALLLRAMRSRHERLLRGQLPSGRPRSRSSTLGRQAQHHPQAAPEGFVGRRHLLLIGREGSGTLPHIRSDECFPQRKDQHARANLWLQPIHRQTLGDGIPTHHPRSANLLRLVDPRGCERTYVQGSGPSMNARWPVNPASLITGPQKMPSRCRPLASAFYLLVPTVGQGGDPNSRASSAIAGPLRKEPQVCRSGCLQ